MPLRQLYPDPGLGFESSGPIRVDIIAVHGLNWRGKPDADHAWDTWRTPEGPTGHLWLQKELPRRLPDSRIFLYEWNSSLLVSKAKDGWTDKARELLDSIMLERRDVDPYRPIIFFGHSMGGLLIKQALVNASIDPFYWPIRDATSGIAFFATPHRGARQLLITLGGFATRVARKFRFLRSKGELIKVLDGKGMFEDLLQEQWKPHMLRYNIVSFWGSKDEYVPETSSRFNLPREREAIVKLNADHRGVCKFQPDDPTSQDNLRLVLAHVGDLYEKARAIDGDVTAPLMRTASHSTAPFHTATPTSASISTRNSSYSKVTDSQTAPSVARDLEAATTAGDTQVSSSEGTTIPRFISTIAEGSASPNHIWNGISEVLAPSEDEAFKSMLCMESLRKSATPEIASLWAKTCISAGALGLLIHDLEVMKVKLSKARSSEQSDMPNEDLQAMVHHALALHHLRFFASSQLEALAAIQSQQYHRQSDIAENKVFVGGGVFLSSLVFTMGLMIVANRNKDGFEEGPRPNTDVGAKGLSSDYIPALMGTLTAVASVASVGYTGYSHRTASILRTKNEAILALDSEMYKLQQAMTEYEAVVAATGLTSITDAKPASFSGIPGQSDLLGFLQESGIDMDHLLANPTYCKSLLQDRLDKMIRSFQRLEKQGLGVAKVLSLPTPRDVVAMSNLDKRALLLRNVTRGGLVASSEATQLDAKPEPETSNHVAQI